MTNTLLDADAIVGQWRDLDATEVAGNPAGPLYLSGPWTPYDLTAPAPENSFCSECTASHTLQCC
jgi:hypothetical protein